MVEELDCGWFSLLKLFFMLMGCSILASLTSLTAGVYAIYVIDLVFMVIIDLWQEAEMFFVHFEGV